ncbi:hypothetical protein P7C70_g4300, partial [Phenoliferia sp. Uapishka_3]
MRRFSLTRSSNPPSSTSADLSRANTHSGSQTRRPAESDPFADLPAQFDNSLPPPTYQTALQAGLSNHRHSAPVQPQQYQPPPQQQQQRAPPPPTPTPSQPERTAQAGPSRAGTLNRANSLEDSFATLGRYDVILLVDDSPSMVDWWQETKDALMGLVTKCVTYDKDGIELFFLNNDTHLEHVTDASTIREAFDTVVPSGSTPTGLQLDEILRPYVESLEDAKAAKTGQKIKPLVVVVLTDGRADDSDLVREIVVEMAQRLDDIRAPPRQLGISIIQIGDDPDATDFLRELDDDLKAEAGVRDIVATVPFSGRLSTDFVLKAALGSGSSYSAFQSSVDLGVISNPGR